MSDAARLVDLLEDLLPRWIANADTIRRFTPMNESAAPAWREMARVIIADLDALGFRICKP